MLCLCKTASLKFKRAVFHFFGTEVTLAEFATRRVSSSASTMSGRAIISYDDIAPSQPPEISSSSDQPPAKRRKKSKNASGGGRNTQHWDDPSPSVSHSHSYAQSHKAPSATAGRPRVGPREETRDLTHEEIWDDSALIDAWNAANEEYEVLNGPDKQWKSKPAHDSAL